MSDSFVKASDGLNMLRIANKHPGLTSCILIALIKSLGIVLLMKHSFRKQLTLFSGFVWKILGLKV